MNQFSMAWMASVGAWQESPGAGPTAQGVNPVGMPGSEATQGITAQPQGGAGGTSPTPPSSSMWIMLPLAIIPIMLLMSGMSGRKEKKRRQTMMDALKKNDKVLMAGGVMGTVAEIGERDLVIRVEEGKIRFHRSALQEIVTSAKGGGKESTLTETKEPAKVGV